MSRGAAAGGCAARGVRGAVLNVVLKRGVVLVRGLAAVSSCEEYLDARPPPAYSSRGLTLPNS